MFYLQLDNTRSNRTRVIKTPGGKLRYLHIKKPGKGPRCGDCGITLPGVPPPPFLFLSLFKSFFHSCSRNLCRSLSELSNSMTFLFCISELVLTARSLPFVPKNTCVLPRMRRQYNVPTVDLAVQTVSRIELCGPSLLRNKSW